MSLSGPEKAAVLIIGLGEELAAAVVKHLDEEQLKRLAASAERLDPRMMHRLEDTFEEFNKLVKDPAQLRSRDAGTYLRDVATKALGAERAGSMFSTASPDDTGPIAVIRRAPPKTIAEVLKEEHPQVGAVILSRLPQPLAVQILDAMPANVQTDFLARLAALTEVPEETAQLASEALAQALDSAGAVSTASKTKFDGVAFTARLLNELPSERSKELIESLEQKGSAVAPKIRQAMFTFEDLLRVNQKGIQLLMREVSTPQLLIAMKTASEPLREHLLSAISSRAAATMREDMAVMPPMRLSEVEGAQREIVESALRLAGEGRITLPGSGSEKLV